MPEHFHMLVSEPRTKPLFRAMQVLKQRVSLQCRQRRRRNNQLVLWKTELPPTFWQPRYYDFNVYSEKKKVEKLRYMHRNPVKRGLVESPEQWRWSSYRYYGFGEKGPVKIGE
jgi:putative transposase